MKEQKENWDERFHKHFPEVLMTTRRDSGTTKVLATFAVKDFIRKEIKQAREEEREKMEWEYKNQTERDEAYN